MMLITDDQKRRELNSRRGAAFVLSIFLPLTIQPFQFGYTRFERLILRMQGDYLRLQGDAFVLQFADGLLVGSYFVFPS